MSWADRDDEGDRHDGEDEGDEEQDENDFKTQKDAVIFAIEVSKSMLKKPPHSDSKKADQDSAITAALTCAYQLMKQRIISHPKDMMGVLLFGTEKSKFQKDASNSRPIYPHCYLLTDLDIPSAGDVKTLRDLAEKGKDPDRVLVPTDEMTSMANVLFAANQIFTVNAANFGSRRLFIITDNDDPHAGDKTLRSSATVRAKDLFDLGVTIELFPINHEGQMFNIEKFYNDIVYSDPTVSADSGDHIKTAQSGNGLSLLNSLISNITSKKTPKRAYFSNMNFELAPGLTISVNGYMLLTSQKAARSCYVHVGGVKRQVVHGKLMKTEETTHRAVEKSEMKKAYKFGGEYVHFAPDELAAIKKFEDKCLRVIGFKPRSMLPVWASVRKSVFIAPAEENVNGSKRVFAALWQKLLKSKKMAIAWHVSRKNGNPILVAILPSKNPSDESSGTSYLPAGLWLYPLPFVDDLRDIDTIKPKEVHQASDDLINDMRIVVQNLQLPKAVYNPTKYPNPSLQHHYNVLQSLAMEEDVDHEMEDLTIPKYKAIAKRVGGYQVDFSNRLSEESQRLVAQLSIKREAEEDADDRPKKKRAAVVKKPAGGGGSSLAELKAAAEDRSLQKMTLPILKEVLLDKGLGTGGKKADLVERLEQWLEEQ